MDKEILEKQKQNLQNLINRRKELEAQEPMNYLEDVCRKIQIQYLSQMIDQICAAFQRNGIKFP